MLKFFKNSFEYQKLFSKKFNYLDEREKCLLDEREKCLPDEREKCLLDEREKCLPVYRFFLFLGCRFFFLSPLAAFLSF